MDGDQAAGGRFDHPVATASELVAASLPIVDCDEPAIHGRIS
jgi:hypothetical protein